MSLILYKHPGLVSRSDGTASRESKRGITPSLVMFHYIARYAERPYHTFRSLSKLLKKDVSATVKLPIIIILIAFPFIGVFLYYFSFENKLRKKWLKNSKNQTFTLESLYIEDSNIRHQLLSEDKMIYKQSQYIANNTFLPVYNNTEFNK